MFTVVSPSLSLSLAPLRPLLSEASLFFFGLSFQEKNKKNTLPSRGHKKKGVKTFSRTPRGKKEQREGGTGKAGHAQTRYGTFGVACPEAERRRPRGENPVLLVSIFSAREKSKKSNTSCHATPADLPYLPLLLLLCDGFTEPPAQAETVDTKMRVCKTPLSSSVSTDAFLPHLLSKKANRNVCVWLVWAKQKKTGFEEPSEHFRPTSQKTSELPSTQG